VSRPLVKRAIRGNKKARRFITAGGPFLFDVSRTLLTISLAGQRLFRAPFLAWFQVKRVSLDFLDDVFLLYLAFEAPQSAFERLSIL
jgi:hypothetical protein